MTTEEARTLLHQYAEGILAPKDAQELEAMLAGAPELQKELHAIKEENKLLADALAPLRSSRSARMRLSEAMQNAHDTAQDLAEGLPQRSWRVARLSFVLLALIAGTAAAEYYPVVAPVGQEFSFVFYAVLGVYGFGIALVLVGNTLARMEAKVWQAVQARDTQPSALEVLTVEVFGMFAVLGAIVLYFVMLPH